MNVKNYIIERLTTTFKELGYDIGYIKVSFSDKENVDLQCNSAFALAKKYLDNPINIANKIKNGFDNSTKFFNITISNPGFINFQLTNILINRIGNDVLNSDRISVPKSLYPQTIILDYGGANIAKPLHVGHLRSAIIGQSLKNLYRFLGHKVISDVHLGDWGLQMGLTIAQLMDDYDMSGYFTFSKDRQIITSEMLDIEYPKASARKKEDNEFSERASEITLRIQNKEKGYYDIWREIRKVSIIFLKKSYGDLGVDFDLWLGESSVNDLVPKIIQIFIDKNLSYESDGALVVDVKNDLDTKPMPPAIIQKSNGAQMYIITDIATMVDRMNNYSPDKIIYITDNRQILHFEQWFRCARLAKLIPTATQLIHIPFGTVNGKDGKPFKTRDGGTLKLDDLINMVINEADKKLIDNGIQDNQIIAKTIALSAIKFGDLINIVSKDYIFDIDKFLNFIGKTGPYIQYTGVRIKSILAKEVINNFKINIFSNEERKIVIDIIKLIDSFEVSYYENSLNSLCQSIFDLASSYSNFYNNIKILSEDNSEKKHEYLSISKLTLKVLEISLNIIGIEIPIKM